MSGPPRAVGVRARSIPRPSVSGHRNLWDSPAAKQGLSCCHMRMPRWPGLAIALCLVGLVVGKSSVVTDIDFDNHYSFWKKNDVTVVMFFDPKSAKGKEVAPIWDELAAAVQGKAVVAKVDGTDDLEFASEYGARRFPAVKLFKKGLKEVQTFGFQREFVLPNLQHFVEQWLGPSPLPLTSAQAVDDHMAKQGAVVGLFEVAPPPCTL